MQVMGTLSGSGMAGAPNTPPAPSSFGEFPTPNEQPTKINGITTWPKERDAVRKTRAAAFVNVKKHDPLTE